VIEFALLFGLGFLTAVFLVFLIAPAIHRRIVWFTEKRLRATMPLSPQEVRAQKDMARALYAAENARTEQSLAREREKSISLQLRQGEMTKEAGRLAAEADELRSQIDDMNVEAGDLRSRLRREEIYVSQIKASLRISEQSHAQKESDLDTLRKRLHKSATDADNLRIDLAARETEAESLRFRFNSLRDERDTLRHDLKLMTTRAKSVEQHLAEEESKVMRLENKLGREIAGNADKDTNLERRLQELARLKEKLKAANVEAREASRALRAAGISRTIASAKTTNGVKSPAGPQLVRDAGKDVTQSPMTTEAEQTVETDIAKLADEVRNRSNALSDRLLKSRSPSHDQAMREELAAIAANMVAMTALKEGDQSPIYKLLPENPEHGQGGRISLAERTSDLLPDC
jgi:chromosome segregation ATPase